MRGGRAVTSSILAAATLLWSTGVSWALPVGVTPYFSLQSFTWREYQAGRQLLKESGPVFAGGVRAEYPLSPASPFSAQLTGRFEVFGGLVNYDGETQAPTPVPVQTEVSYVGTAQDLDLGGRCALPQGSVEPFAGVGYRWWVRGLYDSTASNGQEVSGYSETWHTAYLRLGARGRYRATPELSLFAEGGARYPFYIGNSVEFQSAGTATFHPGAQWSAFGETGVQYRRLRVGVSYEGFRFSPSQLVRVGTTSYFQPQSASDLIGLNLGWSF